MLIYKYFLVTTPNLQRFVSEYIRTPLILDWSTPAITRNISWESIQCDREGTKHECSDLLDQGVIYKVKINRIAVRSITNKLRKAMMSWFVLLESAVRSCHHLSTPSNSIWIHICLTVVRYTLPNLILTPFGSSHDTMLQNCLTTIRNDINVDITTVNTWLFCSHCKNMTLLLPL